MTEVIDYGRFAERWTAATDRPARWALLREFQEEWGVISPKPAPAPEPAPEPESVEDGTPAAPPPPSPEMIAAFLERQKARVDATLPIPAAVEEWWYLPFNSVDSHGELYGMGGDFPPTLRPDPTEYGVATALPPDNPFVAPDADLRVCVFLAEQQYCNEWGYPAAEAGRDDPRIVVSTDEDEDGNTVWQEVGRCASEFFMNLTAVHVPRNKGWCVMAETDPERVKATLPSLGLPPWTELGETFTAYGAPDAIFYLDADGGVEAYGRTEEAVVAAGRIFGEDWAEEVAPPEFED